VSDVGGVAGVLVGVLGLATAFVIYRLERQRKGLGLAVLTNRPLLTGESPFVVNVQHEGQPVGEPRGCSSFG